MSDDLLRALQIVVGPRQTGTTTAVAQALARTVVSRVEFSFDRPGERRAKRLEETWRQARELFCDADEAILSLDEVQKVPDRSSTVKFLWDENTRAGRNLKAVLTGSSTLMLQGGVAESLAGRFERFPRRSDRLPNAARRSATLGDYAGAGMLSAIIEPTIAQDVIETEAIRKLALLRALFETGAVCSAREISYRKLLGQLDDRGNTGMIAHCLELLSHAGMLSGLKTYDEKMLRARSISPRLMAYDPALMTAELGSGRATLLGDRELLGRVAETAVGAYLVARSKREGLSVTWWRDGAAEADFVVACGRRRTAIEVKSGRAKGANGLGAFVRRYPGTYALIVGADAFPVEDFLLGRVPIFQ